MSSISRDRHLLMIEESTMANLDSWTFASHHTTNAQVQVGNLVCQVVVTSRSSKDST